ncbi:N-hydroxyarylamine O-acetyltransferase [Seinonella peptonophila]|uniref:N-hydroxyarylamine O-acetyltransferase n=1 Tax=Seinonella peptonophila TaxID=112248 RepID=A0A1M4YDD0_9BACL|nr:arylamine N-acetyltransferase [Seinonella peptonophila]SHF03760.1 N-hydroxyarylamine O-acetyltransferase [Seinonella peptonophila]
MNIKQYLQRINSNMPNSLDFDHLTLLQKQHLLHIYFENLDILNGKPLSLSAKDLFTKLIIQRRGGVCFELNGLFYYFLQELGYKPTLMAGTVYLGNGKWAIEHAHLFLIIPLEHSEYVVDVGFGGNCPRVPIALNGEICVDPLGQVFRVNREKRYCYVQKREEQTWKTLYRFEREADHWSLDKLVPICRIVETDPDSSFQQDIFCSRVTELGRVTLIGNKLTIVENGSKRKQRLSSAEIPLIVKQYFQLELSDG